MKENIHIYKGSENPMTSYRIYNTEFLCDYELQYYPFDVQDCHMYFRMKNGNASLVNLKSGQLFENKILAKESLMTPFVVSGVLNYLGPVDMTIYFIRSFSIEAVDLNHGYQGIKISIKLGRRLLGKSHTFVLLAIFVTLL